MNTIKKEKRISPTVQKDRWQRIRILFLTFFKIGAFTFGGGYAMLPLIAHEVIDRRNYLTDDEFKDMVAIAEATPGVIAVNTATFVGYRTAGLLGSLAATFGVVLPSFIIITILSFFYTQFRDNVWVGYAFNGIAAGVVVLMIAALIRMTKNSEHSLFCLILAIAGFAIAAFTDIQVVFILLAGGALGLLRQVWVAKKQVK